jgi:hypothetical protein
MNLRQKNLLKPLRPARWCAVRRAGNLANLKTLLAILPVLISASCSKPPEEESQMSRTTSSYFSDLVAGQLRISKSGSAAFVLLNGAPVRTVEGSDSYIESESGGAKAQPAIEPMFASNYTAKQAFARLMRALRSQRRPMPEALWLVHPQSSYVLDVGRNLKVGSWVFFYQDASKTGSRAVITCRGDVQIESGGYDPVFRATSPIRLGDWIVDSSDALARTLSRGAAWYSIHPIGGWLVNIDIQNVGIRPVWVGDGQFLQTDSAGGARGLASFLVDATSGEIYGMEGRDSPQRVLAPSLADEGQRPSSKSEQYAYRGPDGHVVYDQDQINSALIKEGIRAARNASSWATSGVMKAAVADWLGAGDDLDRAVNMERNNSQRRYYRSIISVAVRDFGAASSDLRDLGPDLKAKASEATRIIETLKNKPIDEASIVVEAKTNNGVIPIEIWIGTQPLTRPAR